MLELTPISRKECLWSAGGVAFAMHGMVIATLAFGTNPYHGTSLQNFEVEMMFASSVDKGSGEQAVSKPKASKSVQKYVEKKATSTQISSMDSQPSGEARAAFPVFNPPPIYPKEARRKKVQGVVMVRASLSEEGGVSGATTLPPRIDPLLEEAALRAIRQWRFKPGVRVIEVPIEFKLLT